MDTPVATSTRLSNSGSKIGALVAEHAGNMGLVKKYPVCNLQQVRVLNEGLWIRFDLLRSQNGRNVSLLIRGLMP